MTLMSEVLSLTFIILICLSKLLQIAYVYESN